MQYYIHYECPECGEDVYSLGVNLVDHNGLPVFDLDQFSQTTMTCSNDECGYTFGTGDIDIIGENEW